MNRKQSSLALAVIILSAAAVVHAVSPPETTTSPAPAVDRTLLSPMHRDIEAAVEQERTQVEELNRRFLAASSLTDRIAIQKEIEATKRSGMIAVFEIQLRHAEAEGRTSTADQLRTTIEAVRNPKAPAGINR